MIRRLLYLFAGCAAFWLLTALPVRMLGGGDMAVAYAGTATLLCFVPAALTLAWALWGMAQQDKQQQLLVVIGGGGVRMFVVLVVGLLLSEYVPYYQERPALFLLWVAAAYLFTLALEIALLLVGRSHAADDKGVESK